MRSMEFYLPSSRRSDLFRNHVSRFTFHILAFSLRLHVFGH